MLPRSRSGPLRTGPGGLGSPPLGTLENLGRLGSRRRQLRCVCGGADSCAPFPSPRPSVSKRRRHRAVPPPQPVPSLRVGVSGVVVRAARDKGRLSDARPDLGRRFPDARPAADSRPGRPQRPAPAAPGRAAPGGRKWGGARGGAESTFPLKPRRNVGGFPETRPRPPAGPPAPHLDLLPRERQEGRGGSPGGPGSSPPSAPAPSGLVERKGGWVGGNQALSLFSGNLGQRPSLSSLSFPFRKRMRGVFPSCCALSDASYVRCHNLLPPLFASLARPPLFPP